MSNESSNLNFILNQRIAELEAHAADFEMWRDNMRVWGDDMRDKVIYLQKQNRKYWWQVWK